MAAFPINNKTMHMTCSALVLTAGAEIAKNAAKIALIAGLSSFPIAPPIIAIVGLAIAIFGMNYLLATFTTDLADFYGGHKFSNKIIKGTMLAIMETTLAALTILF